MQRIIGAHFDSWAHWSLHPLIVASLICLIVFFPFILLSKENYPFIYSLNEEKISKRTRFNKRLLFANIFMAAAVSFCIVLIYLQIFTHYRKLLSVESAAWIQAAGSILAIATVIYANFLGQHSDRANIKKDELYRRESRVRLMLRMRQLVEDSPNETFRSPDLKMNKKHLDQIKVCMTIIDIELENRVYLDDTYGALRLFRDHISLRLQNIIQPYLHSDEYAYVDYCMGTANEMINILKIFNIRIEHD
jgi:hypothetical protein